MPTLQSAWKMIEHNRYLAIGIVLMAAVAVGMVGCQPKTMGLLGGTEKVTLPELERGMLDARAGLAKRHAEIQATIESYEADVSALADHGEAAVADLERQIAQRAQIVEIVGGLGQKAAQGELTPSGIIGGFAALAGVGALVDNRRKDKIIRDAKTAPPQQL